jgi:hypothetical protein
MYFFKYVAMLCSVQGKTSALILLHCITGYYAFHGRVAGDVPVATLGHTHKSFGTTAVNSHYTDWIVIFQAS